MLTTMTISKQPSDAHISEQACVDSQLIKPYPKEEKGKAVTWRSTNLWSADTSKMPGLRCTELDFASCRR